jgi:hypothetical protein
MYDIFVQTFESLVVAFVLFRFGISFLLKRNIIKGRRTFLSDLPYNFNRYEVAIEV